MALTGDALLRRQGLLRQALVFSGFSVDLVGQAEEPLRCNTYPAITQSQGGLSRNR